MLESTGTFLATITALPAKMRFDTDVMTLSAGRPVAIQFNNSSIAGMRGMKQRCCWSRSEQGT